MSELKTYSKERFTLLGITKQGHALTSICLPIATVKVVIKKRDYNKLLLTGAIEGAITDANEADLKVFKTLQW